MARAMNTINAFDAEHGKVDPRVVIGIAIAAVVILGAAWWLMRGPETAPVPSPGESPDAVAPAETAAERGDSAREIIQKLSAADGAADYEQAYQQAREFQMDGRLADAQLLYFFAARGGNGPAAFDLATLHDPNHYSQASSLMAEPDPFQAYRWYRSAETAGHQGAGARLAELREWAEEAAGKGDAEAERLLLQWE